MTEQPTRTLETCYARHRRADRAAVHFVPYDADRALCGVWRGDDLPPGVLATCYQCKDAAKAHYLNALNGLTLEKITYNGLSTQAQVADRLAGLPGPAWPGRPRAVPGPPPAAARCSASSCAEPRCSTCSTCRPRRVTT
jgi:hypothetical protein